MAAKKMPDHEYLLSQIAYCPDSGLFHWKVKRKGRFPDKEVGSLQKNGYLLIALDGIRYFAHRLAWFYVNATDPVVGVDHRDGCRSNNRISNLRVGDQGKNLQNIRLARRDNVSGYLGVAVHAGGFTAQIHLNGKKKHLGIFSDPAIAHQAYLSAKREFHEFCEI